MTIRNDLGGKKRKSGLAQGKDNHSCAPSQLVFDSAAAAKWLPASACPYRMVARTLPAVTSQAVIILAVDVRVEHGRRRGRRAADLKAISHGG